MVTFLFINLRLKIDHSFQLSNPTSMKPPLKFGTVPWTYTEGSIKKTNPTMYEYMKNFNKTDVMQGINAVKRG